MVLHAFYDYFNRYVFSYTERANIRKIAAFNKSVFFRILTIIPHSPLVVTNRIFNPSVHHTTIPQSAKSNGAPSVKAAEIRSAS